MPEDRNEYQQQEEECERRDTKEGDPLSTPVTAHWPLEPFGNQVHAGHHEQGHKEGEGQPENDRPG